MSTQFYTQDQPATTQPGTRHAPRRGGPSWYRIAAIAIGAVAAAALIVLAISGLTGAHPARPQRPEAGETPPRPRPLPSTQQPRRPARVSLRGRRIARRPPR